jgi:hypothetical protein
MIVCATQSELRLCLQLCTNWPVVALADSWPHYSNIKLQTSDATSPSEITQRRVVVNAHV